MILERVLAEFAPKWRVLESQGRNLSVGSFVEVEKDGEAERD
jgi:hypothetical protein